ncbi:DUF1116 domain-containing protein [Ignatzschineria rhizosphaerae]|uniref:DUF1116 domain-containing protein n=1 Tax=Ignatzschineria rhizosphaerae TaxID=2923279 RepID=A0ABY3WZL1_9GAMM|nr:DUF1116 domain-containing protein [Ignatzschineria rhizosphaerae]UNM94971.1 DUF1116 domain-containing protein [Ignatzschineria rhizosphaerae]
MNNKNLFEQQLSVINVGGEIFKTDLERQGVDVVQVNWKPRIPLSPKLQTALEKLKQPEIVAKITEANQKAVDLIIQAHPVLVGYEKAIDVVPGMKKNMIIHAGPPIEWEKMCGAMKGAVTGAIVFEGLAKDIQEAEKVAASGDIIFSPCHEHDCVGSMAGVTSASMYMHVVKNKTHGNIAYTNLSEQLARILRMGANDQSVIDRLIWMRDVLGPILSEAMGFAKEIDLRMLLAQAIQMGDEDHNRNNAGTALLVQQLTPHILKTDFPNEDKIAVFEFIASSEYFSGPTWMAYCKAALDAAHGVKNSSIVTTMCRNGVDFGIRLSHFEGFNWFVGPAQKVIGPMMAGYTEADSGLDIGDSAITETYGIGAFAMAAAPAIVPLVGGTVEEAINYSIDMLDITTDVNPNITIPILNFRGIATGIDAIKVVDTGMLPIINTAIAHKDAGIGMIGTGLTNPPFSAFEKALIALAESIA